MHDAIPKQKPKRKRKKADQPADAVAEFEMPRRVGDCLADVPVAANGCIFDAFWREGELALMFGPSGVGKSLFAVQLADALASGRGIDGFEMPSAARNVLYVDLVMSEPQFKRRYMIDRGPDRDPEVYGFSRRFYRGQPTDTSKLAAWVRGVIKAGNFRVVVIDDLSAIKQTHDGTRETLKLMRELKKIKDETGVSILVVAGAERSKGRDLANERDLGRSRVLADPADSVFALGYHPSAAGRRYLMQIRSRNARVVWNGDNAPVSTIEINEPGFPALAFDERFSLAMDEATREMICTAHQLRTDETLTLKQIAEKLGISISTVSRLLKKWSPALEDVGDERSAVGSRNRDDIVDDDHYEDDDDEEWTEAEAARYFRDIGQSHLHGKDRPPDAEAKSPPDGDVDVSRIPFGAGMGQRSIYDLPSYIDKFGVTYYVEKYEHHTNRPQIFYHINRAGLMVRHERKLFAIFCKNLGPPPWLPRESG